MLKKGLKKTSGKNKQVHYLDYSDSFLGACVCETVHFTMGNYISIIPQ